MRTFLLTETGTECRLSYVTNCLAALLSATGVRHRETSDDRRQKILLEVPDRYESFLVAELKQRLAEIIVIGYKYDFFRRTVRLNGLSEEQKELFLTAIIAADLSDDRKYAEKRLEISEETSVDGIYNFRLQRLTEKWKEIADCLPMYFSTSLYHDFMQYLIDDFSKKPVYVVRDQVFDERYNRRNLGSLSGEESALTCAKEILLCGGKEVHLVGSATPKTEDFLREFYGTNVFFHKEEAGIPV